MPDSAWHRWGRHAVATTLGLVVVWHAFVVHRSVPILDLVDLAVHEVGHLLAAFSPTMVMFIAGSVVQVLVPLALAWYFGRHQGDPAGGGFCLVWAGASAWDVSVYIADAPIQALPLIGGGQHDWAYLLGPRGWDAIHLADEIAAAVDAAGALVAVAGLGIVVWAGVRGALSPQVRIQPVPLVDPSGRDPWLEAARAPLIPSGRSEHSSV